MILSNDAQRPVKHPGCRSRGETPTLKSIKEAGGELKARERIVPFLRVGDLLI